MNIEEKYKLDIMVSECRHLIDTMITIYGADEAVRLWEQISNVLDPAIKAQVIISALSKDDSAKIYMTGIDHHIQNNSLVSAKIVAIKSIRSFTSCTLAEAKEMYESCVNGNTIILRGSYIDRRQTTQELKSAGVKVL